MKRFSMSTAHNFHDLTRLLIGREVQMGDKVIFVSEVDLSEVELLRARLASGEKPSYTAFVLKALALAMRDFPYSNRRLVRRWLPFFRSRMQQFEHCDIAVAVERDMPGVAVATFADVIRDVDQKSLADLTVQLRAMATCSASDNRQWRDYSQVATRLPPWLSSLIVGLPRFFPSLWSKWRGAAVMVSSPSKYGVDTVIGGWTSPCAISFGLVKKRAVVRGDRIVACQTFDLTLSFDRRVMAGAQAARYFKRIIENLENATQRLLEPAPARPASAPAAEPMHEMLVAARQN
jgi:pyruvate/2-oxoglutarate dehydrogenase complex dihydrolipoamide acyltransferase (E2) component